MSQEESISQESSRPSRSRSWEKRLRLRSVRPRRSSSTSPRTTHASRREAQTHLEKKRLKREDQGWKSQNHTAINVSHLRQNSSIARTASTSLKASTGNCIDRVERATWRGAPYPEVSSSRTSTRNALLTA